jgi:hypothetical protein
VGGFEGWRAGEWTVGCGFVRGRDAESRTGFWALVITEKRWSMEMQYARNFSPRLVDSNHMLGLRSNCPVRGMLCLLKYCCVLAALALSVQVMANASVRIW